MSRAQTLILVALVLAAASGLWRLNKTLAPKPPAPGQQVTETISSGAPTIGGPFTLQSATGPVNEKNLLGHYTLLYFGYSHCPDVCPTVLATLAEVMQKLPAAQQAKLQVVFISVDPARDTPQSLQTYVRGFNPAFKGWTGTPAQLDQITHEYLTYYARRPNPADPNGYSMDHSSIIYLTGPDGGFLTNFGHADSAAAIGARLAPLLR